MSHFNVSSSFISQTRSKKFDPVRTFTIASSDYSERVLKWPKFNFKWDDIRPKNVQLRLSNEDGGMNFLRNDKTLMRGTSILAMGIVGETIELFEGEITDIEFNKGICTVTITNKFQQLSDRKMGTSDSPVDYTTSNYLPSDMAWWAITSYGGYSTVQSTSNPDIDYTSFNDWAAIFSGDAVLVQGIFDGQKVTEVLRKIARNTHSAIFINQNKLHFHRFGIADASVTSLSDTEVMNAKLRFSTRDVINRQLVSGDYDVDSDFHQFTVFDESSVSVDSFGLKENIVKDVNFWYVNSQSAINFAQRRILANADPDDRILVDTTLVGLPRVIGETIYYEESFFGISESYRIMAQDIDMDKGKTSFDIDRTQLTNAFILDTSTLDNTVEVLT